VKGLVRAIFYLRLAAHAEPQSVAPGKFVDISTAVHLDFRHLASHIPNTSLSEAHMQKPTISRETKARLSARGHRQHRPDA